MTSREEELEERCRQLEGYAMDAWEIIELLHAIQQDIDVDYPHVVRFLKREIP